MVPFFASIYHSLLEKIRKTAKVVHIVHEYEETIEDVISQSDFVSYCRWMTRRRIDRVYSRFRGEASDDIKRSELDVLLPKVLHDVIHGIGVITVALEADQVLVCPQPDSNDHLDERFPTAVDFKFQWLVYMARNRGLNIQADRLSSCIGGSSWWLLSARELADDDFTAHESDKVKIFGLHPANSQDYLLAAIVQNGYDGLYRPAQRTRRSYEWILPELMPVSRIREIFLFCEPRPTYS